MQGDASQTLIAQYGRLLAKLNRLHSTPVPDTQAIDVTINEIDAVHRALKSMHASPGDPKPTKVFAANVTQSWPSRSWFRLRLWVRLGHEVIAATRLSYRVCTPQ
jgi:hypothetical protein